MYTLQTHTSRRPYISAAVVSVVCIICVLIMLNTVFDWLWMNSSSEITDRTEPIIDCTWCVLQTLCTPVRRRFSRCRFFVYPGDLMLLLSCWYHRWNWVKTFLTCYLNQRSLTRSLDDPNWLPKHSEKLIPCQGFETTFHILICISTNSTWQNAACFLTYCAKPKSSQTLKPHTGSYYICLQFCAMLWNGRFTKKTGCKCLFLKLIEKSIHRRESNQTEFSSSELCITTRDPVPPLTASHDLSRDMSISVT